jgi:Kef-type K+ transport system membrane component KefB
MDSYLFLRDLAILVFAAKFLSVTLRHYGAPAVVGQILAGLIVGPCLFGWVHESLFIDQMAEIGVIMLMFEAGLGTDMKKLRKTGAKATAIACSGVSVPMVLGCILYMAFYGWGPVGSDTFIKGLFIGTIMAATSVSITVAALQELGRLNGLIGTTITSAAIIDDVIGIIVLTFVIGLKSSSANTGTIVIKSLLFFAFALISGIIVYNIFKWLDSRYEHTRRIPIIGLCYALLMAYIAETYFGLADITGAYVAGIVLCNLFDASYIQRRVDIASYMIFSPVFFAGIGLKTSFSSMNATLLIFSICFVIVACLGKVIGCGLCAKLCKFNNHESLIIGVGMMTRGEVALITAQKGLSVNLLTSDFFTPVILMILFSSIVVPILLKRLYAQSHKLSAD